MDSDRGSIKTETLSKIMRMAATWNGTKAEAGRLLAAIARNCTCRDNATCPPHAMLVGANAQKIVDSLLFSYRIRERLIIEEFNTSRR